MKTDLAQNIRRMRKEHGLTQEQLADALGVTPGAVYKWEAGLSQPEIRLLMEMADLFESSVDSLLGYVSQSGSVQGRIKRIREHLAEKNFDEAILEAEKALGKYPNNFRLIYTCAFMYMVKTAEDKSRDSMIKSNRLFEKALSLLDSDPDEDINEMTIFNYMATNYISVGDMEKALEILKKNNIRNINGSMISYLYAVELKKADESVEFAQKTVIENIIATDRVVFSLSFAYALKRDRACMSSLKWLIDYLDSLKTESDQPVYTDKFKVLSLALLAVWEEMFGLHDEAEEHITEAYGLASRFDASPVYDAKGILFLDDPDKKMIDSFGKTVRESVEEFVFDKVPKSKAATVIRKRWNELSKA